MKLALTLAGLLAGLILFAPASSRAQAVQPVQPALSNGGRCLGVAISSSVATEVVQYSTFSYNSIFVQNITAPSTAAIYGSYASADISTAAATGAGIILKGGDTAVTPRVGGSATIPLKAGASFYFLCNGVNFACRATVCGVR